MSDETTTKASAPEGAASKPAAAPAPTPAKPARTPAQDAAGARARKAAAEEAGAARSRYFATSGPVAPEKVEKYGPRPVAGRDHEKGKLQPGEVRLRRTGATCDLSGVGRVENGAKVIVRAGVAKVLGGGWEKVEG